MSIPTVSDAEFIELVETKGCKATAKKLGVSERGVNQRRVRLENRYKRQITSPHTKTGATRHNISHPGVLVTEVPKDGHILIGGDAHYWPGPATTAHRAFVAFIKELRPKCVIMNGDVIDGATISRHPGGWEKRPTFAEELENAQERMAEIELATPRSVPLFWPLGNHDARLETRIATVAPELAKLHGVHLKDHFSNRWNPCHRVDIGEQAIVLHSFRGGIHATHNNQLYSGRTTITNHLHSQKVTPFTDLNGTRYGVDTGCIASVRGRQFDYVGARPVNWREGFAVLTFRDHKLLMPELVAVWEDDYVQWRGEIIKV